MRFPLIAAAVAALFVSSNLFAGDIQKATQKNGCTQKNGAVQKNGDMHPAQKPTQKCGGNGGCAQKNGAAQKHCQK